MARKKGAIAAIVRAAPNIRPHKSPNMSVANGTYGHLHSAMDELNRRGKKAALAHFKFINPLPKNTEEVLRRYKKIVVAEQNMGQLAGYLRMKIEGIHLHQFNQVKGQPFVVQELVEAFTKLMEE